MLGSLPPVGRKVAMDVLATEGVAAKSLVDGSPVSPADRVLRDACLYSSGTMALARAMMIARDHAYQQRGIRAPEVLLPAYGCPDIVSAALYARVKPVLVDLEPDHPWMNLEQVQQRITPNTAAVVAAHLLGLSERLKALQALAQSNRILLIEDSAQLFPTKATDEVWRGDLVVLSFSRGKPVNLLGGGALLCNTPELQDQLDKSRKWRHLASDWRSLGLFRLKATIYNSMLKPHCYRILQGIPILNIGQTVFKPLSTIGDFPPGAVALLPANLYGYQGCKHAQETWIHKRIAELRKRAAHPLVDFSGSRTTGVPLLRYPILVESAIRRDKLLHRLSAAGLGASPMYRTAMHEISGLAQILRKQSHFPAASNFAQRLITLPCHLGVSKFHVEQMTEILQ